MSDVLLELKHLNIVYGSEYKQVTAVNDASITIRRGEVVGLVGESGSGKSTLANGILGILPRTAKLSGSMRFNGIELIGLNETAMNQQVRWRQISIVFQKALAALSPVHRIEEHMIDILRAHDPGIPMAQMRERMKKLMTLVRLPPETVRSYPHQLSGGMLQRVMIALSLLFDPPFVILDEATTALDVLTQRQILSEIRRLQHEFNLTVLMISHDIAAVAENANRIVVMYASQIVEDGPVETVIHAPKHPYTQALLGALPRLDAPTGRVKSIPGSLPDLSLSINQCVFAPRCAYAMDICWQGVPAVQVVEPGHTSKCVRVNEI
ncbi:MAG: ABC transporter ATP-binding protein [Chloroflexi bacterium]|nr:ABC transporter ATP-binding protein [Chloroflexota bacterium]MCC6896910.1 ABC transporter ATP-binding protein [Anaerolineae bacterium]